MPRREYSIELIDTQSGGDVSRIVTAGIGQLPGDSVLEKARYLQQHGDGLRRLLLSEPYGDPAMSVDLILSPSHHEAQAGYVIMEAMGYPMYSGSNTICTAMALLESGMIPIQPDENLEQKVVLESPAGLAHIVARIQDKRVSSITTKGEPAFVARENLSTHVPNFGEIPFSLVWSGAYFAMVEAEPLGFHINAEEQTALAAFGEAFMAAARPGLLQEHPKLGDLGPLPFVHFMGPVTKHGEGRYESPSATYVHPGVICRSPTGTGTSARLALMYHRGQIASAESLETISPRGTRFVGTVLDESKVGDYPALNSHITGGARMLAHSKLTVDLDDPLVDASDLAHLLDIRV